MAASAGDTVVWHQREDARLRSLTKQWLEVVTGQQMPADQSLQDLLADGVVLKLAAKKIKRLMKGGIPTKDVDGEPSKERRQSVGAYTPYNNIDEFINVCKRVGVLDIDLFVPSDVVERTGDLRKLVLCVRGLSKRCRAIDLLVPDFDDVSGTANTPDGSTKSSSEAEKFPVLIMPPTVERVSSPTPESSVTPSSSEHDLTAVKKLQVDDDDKAVVTEKVAPTPFESIRQPFPIFDDETLSGASDGSVLGQAPVLQEPIAEVLEAELEKAIKEAQSENGMSALPSQSAVAPMGSRELSATGTSTPVQSFPIKKREVDIVKAASPGTPSVPQRRSVDDLPGGSYIVVTNTKKKDVAKQGPNTLQSNVAEKKRIGDDSSSKVMPSVSQSDVFDKSIPGPAVRPIVPEKKIGGLGSMAPSPGTASSGSDKQLGDFLPRSAAAVNKPVELSARISDPSVHAKVADKKLNDAAARAIAAPASSILVGRRSLDSSSRVESPATEQKSATTKVPTPSIVPPQEKLPPPVKVSAPSTVPAAPAKVPIPSKVPAPSAQSQIPKTNVSRNTVRSSTGDKKILDASSRTKTGDETVVGTPAKAPQTMPSDVKNVDDPSTKQVSRWGLWIPILAGAAAIVGSFVAIRSRTPAVYEVQEGDTLYKISKRSGKNNWESLVRMNPDIANPDLIYPRERLKLT